MTSAQLAAWRDRMGWRHREAARQLGVSLATYQQLERGVSWKTGKPIAIDGRTELAVMALEAGLRLRLTKAAA